MGLLHKAFNYSSKIIRTGAYFLLILGYTLNSGAKADVIDEPSSKYTVEISTGVVEGSDILAGAEGVYYKFTGSPAAPSPGQSTSNSTTQKQGSSLSIKDDNNEFYFQRINPRTETKIKLSKYIELSSNTAITPSAFISKSSISYAFDRGIGLLVDPARLDYQNIQVGLGIALTQTIDLPVLDTVAISPFTKLAVHHNQTRMHSALIDVTYSTHDTRMSYGIQTGIKPFNKIPISFDVSAEKDSKKNFYLRASVGFRYSF